MGRDETLVLCNEDKKCARCGRERPLSYFYRRKDAKDSLQPYCAECQKEYRLDRKAIVSARRLRVQQTPLGDLLSGTRDMTRTDLRAYRKILERAMTKIDAGLNG